MRPTLICLVAPPCQFLSRGVRQRGHDKLARPNVLGHVGNLQVLRLSSSLYGCATRTAGSKSAGIMRCANESQPTAREQNAWQDGAFRFEHALQSRAYRVDRAEQTRSAHSSPRAQEYAQNAQGHRGHDSSQALGQVISSTASPRTSIFESRSQKASVGALERKKFF